MRTNRSVHALQEVLDLEGWVAAVHGSADAQAQLAAPVPAAAAIVLVPAAGGLLNAALRASAERGEVRVPSAACALPRLPRKGALWACWMPRLDANAGAPGRRAVRGSAPPLSAVPSKPLLTHCLSRRRSQGTWEATRPGGRPDGPRARAAPLRALAAVATLGTGGSLGPEGPSVEIGEATAVAVARGSVGRRTTALFAAGASAGIAAGFNAAVAGVFFAVEVALRQAEERAAETALDRGTNLAPGEGDTSFGDGLPASTELAMVLISAVTASVVSQQGLGNEPAFVVPEFDLRSSAELPLYLVLGLLGGAVSAAGVRLVDAATRAFARAEKAGVAPRALQPALGGAFAGAVALVAPQVLYQGYANLDEILTLAASSGDAAAHAARSSMALLEDGSTPLFLFMLELMALKVCTTAVCKGSGLVGGVYAPSIFIGAALGAGYGEVVNGLVGAAVESGTASPALQVAPPQAYALVGMGAVLAGWCRIPLTATLLLFELTRDDRIILPLMAAVGLSAWAVERLSPRPVRRRVGDIIETRARLEASEAEAAALRARLRDLEGESSESDAESPPKTSSRAER